MPKYVLRSSGVFIAAGVAVGLLAACDEQSVTAPPPPDRVVALNLLPGTDFLKIGESAQFTMEATMADGTRTPMTATAWGCDSPNAASVSGGRVTGLASGFATVYGECQHGRATRLIRVAPDYDGTWAGSYAWRTCAESGQFQVEHVCDEMPVGDGAPILLRLGQNRDRVTGTLVLGALAGDITGLIDVPGDLGVSGTIRYEEGGVAVNVALVDWRTLAEGDRMSGSFRMRWTISGVEGDMVIGCEITSVGRTNQIVQQAAAPVRSRKSGLPALVRSLMGIPR